MGIKKAIAKLAGFILGILFSYGFVVDFLSSWNAVAGTPLKLVVSILIGLLVLAYWGVYIMALIFL